MSRKERLDFYKALSEGYGGLANHLSLLGVGDSSLAYKVKSAKRDADKEIVAHQRLVQEFAQPMADYLKRKRELERFIYDDRLDHVLNVYIDLHGRICPRKNPLPGLYFFDGQFFYKNKRGRKHDS